MAKVYTHKKPGDESFDESNASLL
ncbi:hypothetical protein CCACVL1_18127 [Corchorus capsularis]|uniref:Uncharacterized protein n=1 Tax=Corchorus capsularis TaxID=210143 RepID=A0A1R3HMW0_COCAP|nr:hypothetical protein CCACVL1_18127 [Corchorus capsularis]